MVCGEGISREVRGGQEEVNWWEKKRGRGEEKWRARTGNNPHAALALLAMDAVLQYALERWGSVCVVFLDRGNRVCLGDGELWYGGYR